MKFLLIVLLLFSYKTAFSQLTYLSQNAKIVKAKLLARKDVYSLSDTVNDYGYQHMDFKSTEFDCRYSIFFDSSGSCIAYRIFFWEQLNMDALGHHLQVFNENFSKIDNKHWQIKKASGQLENWELIDERPLFVLEATLQNQ